MCCLCSPSLPFVPSGASTQNIHVPSSLNVSVMEPCMAKETFFTWRGVSTGTGTQDTVLFPHLEINRSHLGKILIKV